MKKRLLSFLLIASSPVLAADNYTVTQTDTYTLTSNVDLMSVPAINSGGTINAIIEIPTGTNQKWEINKDDTSQVIWEFKKGKPRIVNYLGYPANYGAIPSTALPKELGGDGDPLDVIVLGHSLPRGSVAEVRLIGVLKMLDDGEQDDKLLAVMTEGSPLSDITSVSQLDSEFNGVSKIVGTWFSNYKGKDGGMVLQGIEDAGVANEVLSQAVKNYKG